MSKYTIWYKTSDKFVPVDNKELKEKYSDNINDYVKKSLASNHLTDGDIVYELRPVYKIERQLVASRIKTL